MLLCIPWSGRYCESTFPSSLSLLLMSQIVLSPQSSRDLPPAKKMKTEASGKCGGHAPEDSKGQGSLHHYPPTANTAEFPGCLLSKRPLADRHSGGKSPPASASSFSNRHDGENILFCSEEVTYQGESDEEENELEDRGNFPISQEDEEAKNQPPPMLSSSSPPLTPPNFGPGISHHSVMASPSYGGCMSSLNLESGSSGSSNGAVMLSYNNGPWLCSPQLSFSPVETTPIHHHMSCSPLPASPLSCPVMYSPPFTPNLFDRLD